MNRYEKINELLDEINEVISDLFESEFKAIHDITLDDLLYLIEECERYGLRQASILIQGIYYEITEGNNILGLSCKKYVELYYALNNYCKICRSRIGVLMLDDDYKN